MPYGMQFTALNAVQPRRPGRTKPSQATKRAREVGQLSNPLPASPTAPPASSAARPAAACQLSHNLPGRKAIWEAAQDRRGGCVRIVMDRLRQALSWSLNQAIRKNQACQKRQPDACKTDLCRCRHLQCGLAGGFAHQPGLPWRLWSPSGQRQRAGAARLLPARCAALLEPAPPRHWTASPLQHGCCWVAWRAHQGRWILAGRCRLLHGWEAGL